MDASNESTVYQVSLDGFPTEQFSAADKLPGETRPWDRERAWDCYKARYGDKVRRMNTDKVPVITAMDGSE